MDFLLIEHCPNFALFIIHAHRQVVLNICGTEIKSIQDIFMDLCSDSCVFLEGLAHKAMLQGARNIITMILDIILKGSLKYNRLCCIPIFIHIVGKFLILILVTFNI